VRAYTVGCAAQYERWRDAVLFKAVGGSVWPDLSTVLEYFLAIRGTVTLTSSGRVVAAGVYAVELNGAWSSCTEAVVGQEWACLTRPARVVATVCLGLNDATRLMLTQGEQE